MRYFLTAAICLAGGFVQRVSGLGFGMTVMMLLPFLANSYGEATVATGIANIPLAGVIAYSNRKFIRWKKALLPLGPAFITKLISIRLVAELKDYTSLLRRGFGVFLIAAGVYYLFVQKKIKLKPTLPAALICGTISGFCDGFFASGGPPIALYMLAVCGEDKDAYIATSQTYFFFSGVLSLLVRVTSGMVTPDSLLLSVFATAGMFPGVLLGKKIFRRIDPDRLRKTVYCMIPFCGLLLILRG